MRLEIDIDGRPGELLLERTDQGARFRHNGSQQKVASVIRVEPGIYSIIVEDRSFEVKVVHGPDCLYVDLAGHRSVVRVRDPRAFSASGQSAGREGRQAVKAPMPGKVVRVLVSEGDEVEAGAGLVVVEAMKMQNEMKAPKRGRVVQLTAKLGATVNHGEILAAIE